ncbi:ead/Ea22-like family protein [Pseudomonas sp. REB1044]|uniref:ead/Ea22-like family protein n=1 Tax=Pseudomonas sp. REB1044 TaxID=2675224 RepID=UPI00315D6086
MSIDRDKLRALAQAATGGQWVTDGEHINQHGHLLYAYVAHKSSGMIAQAFANCRVKTDAECRANAAFIAAANPANILALLAEFETLLERAAYWRQRAKSAEGHFWNGDCRAAFEEVHRASNYAETPVDQLEVWQVARIESVVVAVLRTVNAQRQRRRPADFVAWREDQSDLAALRKDAERYRWLRERCGVDFIFGDYNPWLLAEGVEMEQVERDTTDSAIDSAIAKDADATERRDNQNLTHQEE